VPRALGAAAILSQFNPESYPVMSCAVLILADGSTCREETLRGLVSFGDDCLINHLSRLALAAGATPVLRVLGAGATAFSARPAPEAVVDVFNPAWARRDGRSVAVGLRAALASVPALDAALLLPCDLPLTSGEPLAQMIRLVQERPDRIVQSDLEDGGRSAPVAFGRAYFNDLLSLDAGCYGRQIVYRHLRNRLVVSFPGLARETGAKRDAGTFRDTGQGLAQR
jgi:molybdenum cofactor cytidylyltransferase